MVGGLDRFGSSRRSFKPSFRSESLRICAPDGVGSIDAITNGDVDDLTSFYFKLICGLSVDLDWELEWDLAVIPGLGKNTKSAGYSGRGEGSLLTFLLI